MSVQSKEEFMEKFDEQSEVLYSAKVNGLDILNDNGEVFYTDDKELLREYVYDTLADQAEEAWADQPETIADWLDKEYYDVR